MECRNIENGKTQMGRITTKGEQNHVSAIFLQSGPRQDLWLGMYDFTL